MSTTTSLLVSSLAFLSGALSSAVPVRIPPYFDSHANSSSSSSSSSWIAPPLNFYAGTWYFRNVSSPLLLSKPNLQWDVWLSVPTCLANSTATCPPDSLAGQMIEITTWSLGPDHQDKPDPFDFGARAGAGGNPQPVASFLGHHTPRRLGSPGLGPAWDGVHDVAGLEGAVEGYRNQWAVLAWGTDARGADFAVIHEDRSTTGGRPSGEDSLDVLTRSPAGADPGTLAGVLGALDGLGDARMSGLVGALEPIVWDAAAAGGPAICPEKCMVNGGASASPSAS